MGSGINTSGYTNYLEQSELLGCDQKITTTLQGESGYMIYFVSI